jgi:protein-tyrosine phosphatase
MTSGQITNHAHFLMECQMTRIWERLWVGGLTDAERLAKGNPNGIDTVISLCAECVSTKRHGVNYVRIPIVDAEPIPRIQFDAVMDALYENLKWGTVLLHCGVGLSRAPSLAAGWMAVIGYKTLDDAIAEIESLREIIQPSKTLFESIRRHL